MKRKIFSYIRAFTLVELIISIAIFAFMTALLVAKYGTFNQSVLLTNLAYDVALTVRTAQTYGLSVKSANIGAPSPFQYAYGTHFSTVSGSDKDFSLFASDPSFVGHQNIYDGDGSMGDFEISKYSVKRGAKISELCSGTEANCASNPATTLDITFRRPDPDAIICPNMLCGGDSYAKITIQATDGSTRAVVVRSNGQVSVED